MLSGAWDRRRPERFPACTVRRVGTNGLAITVRGLSKAYGELMGRLYWDKHGVENVNVRIGSSFPEPVDARMILFPCLHGQDPVPDDGAVIFYRTVTL